MANPDRPRGFEPAGDVKRSAEYVAESAIKPGDMLSKNANGTVEPVATGGSSYVSSCLGAAMTPAAAGEKVQVSDHPDQEYTCQADGSEIAAQTNIGLNYAILATTADSTFEISRMELDSSTGAALNTLPLKLQRVDKGENNALGANVDCVVRINNNELVADAGSLGV